jgi:hypothetical protein
MKRIVRAAAAAGLAVGGAGSIGCVHDGQQAGDGAAGGGSLCRQFIDPCWPERYNATARAEVIAPFAAQVNNGHVLNQTIWNWYFEPGTDHLTAAGRAKLDSIAQTRPVPDNRLYLQAVRDIAVTNENVDKAGALRDDLTVRRAVAVQRYMATQPAIGNAVAYDIFVHDAMTEGIPSAFPINSFRSQTIGYRGGIGGAAGAVGATGGVGSTPASSVGGGGGGQMGPNVGPTGPGPNPSAAPAVVPGM